MNAWFAYIAKLSLVQSQQELVGVLSQDFMRHFDIPMAHTLLLSKDARSLVLPHETDLIQWAVDDFSHPFSHILKNNQTKLLKKNEWLYWQSNEAFKELLIQKSGVDALLIIPLVHYQYTQAILCVWGEYEKLKELSLASELTVAQQIISALLYLWTMNESQRQQAVNLSESLTLLENQQQRKEQQYSLQRQLIGSSSEMDKLRKQIILAANSNLSVLVQGETGTGKELVINATHQFSTRGQKELVAVNCAAIPDSLLESELFGYVKGAFSGATTDKVGLVAKANGGSLFLDEIGDMPLDLQAKLLRLLETKQYRPIGGTKEYSSDFRLLAATHTDLHEKIQNKSFRQDLFYRLNQFSVKVPKLSERKEDIGQLVTHFIHLYRLQNKNKTEGIMPQALEYLCKYEFPGNIRELKNIIFYACALSPEDSYIDIKVIENYIKTNTKMLIEGHRSNADIKSKETIESIPDTFRINNLSGALEQFEMKIIKERLEFFLGDREKTAQSLGLPKRTLAYKCKKMEIN